MVHVEYIYLLLSRLFYLKKHININISTSKILEAHETLWNIILLLYFLKYSGNNSSNLHFLALIEKNMENPWYIHRLALINSEVLLVIGFINEIKTKYMNNFNFQFSMINVEINMIASWGWFLILLF